MPSMSIIYMRKKELLGISLCIQINRLSLMKGLKWGVNRQWEILKCIKRSNCLYASVFNSFSRRIQVVLVSYTKATQTFFL